MIIKLVRHGESKANTREVDPQQVGDHTIPLSPLGRQQAQHAGGVLGPTFLRDALLYTSPYQRAKETLAQLLAGAGLAVTDACGPPKVYEDPRLREVDHGYADVDQQEALRQIHGWFYYRFTGGESPADCYDRTSGFLEGLMRQAERKHAERVLVITHGLTIRCFVMRFLHLTVEQFERLANPGNCDIITVGPKEVLECPQFVSGKWGVCGLRLRQT